MTGKLLAQQELNPQMTALILVISIWTRQRQGNHLARLFYLVQVKNAGCISLTLPRKDNRLLPLVAGQKQGEKQDKYAEILQSYTNFGAKLSI